MMKQLALIAAAAAALAIPALVSAPAYGQTVTSEAQRAQTVKSVLDGRRACVRCDLFQAEFSYLDFSGRTFTGARLRQAQLDLSTMDRTNFSGADLSVANAFGARFTGANFTRANLENANFVGAHLGGANLAGAKLNGAIFAGAELAEARGLTQAQLNTACGDSQTTLPQGLTIPACRSQ
jgi:uncharacterized protein YjbI with pentapeptide repeats